MHAIYGFVRPKPDKQAEVEQHLTALITPSRAEEGNVAYTIHKEEDGTLFLYELWESEAAVQLHNQTPHMQRFFAEFWEKRHELLQQEIEGHTSTIELA